MAPIADSATPNNKVYLSTDNELFEYINGTIDSTELKQTFEAAKKATTRKDKMSITDSFHDNVVGHNWTYTCSAAVTNGLFRSSIYAQMKRSGVLWGYKPHISIDVANGYYKLKNNSYQTQFSGQSINSTNKKIKIKIYSGRRRINFAGLSPYRFNSTFVIGETEQAQEIRSINLPIYN